MKHVIPVRSDQSSTKERDSRPQCPLVPKLKTNPLPIRIEQTLFLSGLLLICVVVVISVGGFVARHLAIAWFDAQTTMAQEVSVSDEHLKEHSDVDFTLWSKKRIQAYEESLAVHSGLPTAVLDIPKLHLRVPVFEGTDDLTLDRGVGRIVGTANPGQPGNIGIAGHRDGFFRGLKEVVLGDAIELETRDVKVIYFVDQVKVVTPEDVSVLKPRAAPSLTLVTCYPFYFCGPRSQALHCLRFFERGTTQRQQRTRCGQSGTEKEEPKK